MEVIRVIPEDILGKAFGEFANAGAAAAQAAARADAERVKIIQRLLDYATGEGIATKVAVSNIMERVVLPCSLTKSEQQSGVTPFASGKLAYSTGQAYARSMELALKLGKPFAPGLYAAHLKEVAARKETEHAAKVAEAEAEAAAKAAAAKAAAAQAAKSKDAAAKAAAQAAKVEAEKANEAVRAAIDAAPVSKKTGGRKAAKTAPAVTLTRHEVAMHATRLVAMLRSIGEECADEIADILSDNNLLVE
jgi:hypothetical protein